jgi:ABC-type sugar transport system ATPase subunit
MSTVMTLGDPMETGVEMKSPLLELTGIDKEFFGNQVLFGVDLELRGGEILSLVGTNGAGKSTLCDVIAGVFRPSAGKVVVDGHEVNLRNPSDAEAVGIGMVHQEPALCQNMSVYENIFLNRELLRGRLLLSRRAMMSASTAVLEMLGYQIDVELPVQDLPLVSKGVVAIAKAMITKPRILILDEVTATLNAEEVRHLFGVVREIRNSGVGVINIGHNIREIVDISDRVIVLRDGRKTADLRADEVTSEKQIISLMLGSATALETATARHQRTPVGSDVMLSVDRISRENSYQGVTFDLRHGEILGLAGLKGSGITEVMFSLFGALPYQQGSVTKAGRTLKLSSPRQAVSAGIGMITNDRQREGLALILPVADNIAIVKLRQLGSALAGVGWPKVAKMAGGFITALGIKTTGPSQPAQYLSGGNQQKVVVAKWLLRGPDVLLVDEPTRGVDVKAKNDIYEFLFEERKKGMGVVVYSPEVLELMKLCDRILVMSRGAIVDEITADDPRFTEQGLLEILHSAPPETPTP